MHEFENYVNYAGSKTDCFTRFIENMFENYVNYAGSKTVPFVFPDVFVFENYVNYAGSKTLAPFSTLPISLRTM